MAKCKVSSLDEDVAAVLGLPSDRFAAREHFAQQKRARWRARWLFCLLLLSLLGIGAILSHLAHPRPQSLAMEARSQKSDKPRSEIMSPGSEGGGLKKPKSSEASSQASAPTKLTDSAADDGVAYAPPTPSVQGSTAHDGLGSPTPAPAPAIVTPPVEKLTGPRAERLALAQASEGDIELGPRVISPHWLSEPDGEEVARAYPEKALSESAPGSVVLGCLELLDGSVVDCRVLEETPGGSGFGRAALRLSHLFRFSPATADGRSVEAQVEIPYDFSVID